MQIKTAADQIADHIRKSIFEGKYLPGDKLKETEIASLFSVSRTPVRESFRRLEAEGLAEFLPNKGVIVPQIDVHDIDEIFELRILIELYCVRKFIRIATERHFEEIEKILDQMKNALSSKNIPNYFALALDFHDYYIKHCQNRRMYAFFNSIRNSMRIAQSILGETDAFCQKSLDEHVEIMRLLKNRSQACEKALRLHIEDACGRMREKIDRAQN
jgi:DNA-binding GntR family transcriptional regulator